MNIIHYNIIRGGKMIKIKFLGIKALFDFSFFAVIALFFLYDSTDLAIYSFVACIIHELAHVFMMNAFDIPPNSLVFYGGGIKISEREIERLKLYKQAIITSAGCVINFIMAGISFALADGSDLKILIFAYSNLMVGAINLLPIGYFDGAGLMKLILIKKMQPFQVDSAMKVVRRMFGFASIFALLLMIVYRQANFTIYVIALYFIFAGFSDRE